MPSPAWLSAAPAAKRFGLPARDRASYRRLMKKPTIGWREWVALPDLDITSVKAKVDTGARSSSLHAFNVEIVKRKKRTMVRFSVHPIQGDTRETVHCEAELVDERWVRSSN